MPSNIMTYQVLYLQAGMPLSRALMYVRNKKADYRCVEVKYADKVGSKTKIYGYGSNTKVSCTPCHRASALFLQS